MSTIRLVCFTAFLLSSSAILNLETSTTLIKHLKINKEKEYIKWINMGIPPK